MITRPILVAACGLAIGVCATACGGGSSSAGGPQVGDCITTNLQTLSQDLVPCSSKDAEERIVAIVDKESQCTTPDTESDLTGEVFCTVEANPPPLRVKVGDCVEVYRHAEKVPCADGADRLLAIVKNDKDGPAKSNGSATDGAGRVFCVHTIGT